MLFSLGSVNYFICVSLVWTSFFACKLQNPAEKISNENSTAEVQGIRESQAAWRKNRIKVCWAQSKDGAGLVNLFFPYLKLAKAKESKFSSQSAEAIFGKKGVVLNFSETEKSLIKKAIKDNFEPTKAVVSFYGWEACKFNETDKTETTQSDLVLLRGQNLENYASSVGQTFTDGWFRIPNKVDKTMAIITSFGDECNKTKDYADCVTGIFLHEIGHVLGLRHEDVHPKAQKDPLCLVDYETGLPRTAENPKPQENLGFSAIVSEYDKESLMNQCHLFARLRGDKRSKITSLKFSSGDLRTIKTIFSEKASK